jgi:thiamine biosynthesis protein ThiS
MILQINGEPRDFADGLALAALVEQLGMKADRVAVELNLEIVARADWAATVLKDGDKLEIVHFVGGGNVDSDTAAVVDADTPTGETWVCPSCQATASGKFCCECGEKKPSRHDLSVRHLLSHVGEVVFHWDSRILRSLRVLLTHPGRLSTEYVDGRRKLYTHPFQVFFIANVLYFLLYPVIGWSGLKTPLVGYQHWMWYSVWATRMATHRAMIKGIPLAELSQRFDHVIDIQSRSMVLLMVPIFAVALFLLEWRRGRYFGEHLVFSLHYIAAWLLLIMIGLSGAFTAVFRVLGPLRIGPQGLGSDYILSILAALIMGLYLFLALRRFYRDSDFWAFAKTIALLAATFEMLDMYRIILFLTALYSV